MTPDRHQEEAVEAARLALQEAAAQRPEAWARAAIEAAYPHLRSTATQGGDDG